MEREARIEWTCDKLYMGNGRLVYIGLVEREVRINWTCGKGG